MLNAPHQTWRSCAVAGVDVDPLHLGGIGMLFEPLDPCRDHTVDGVADVLDILDLEPEPGHHVGEPRDSGLVDGSAKSPYSFSHERQDLHVVASLLRTAR